MARIAAMSETAEDAAATEMAGLSISVARSTAEKCQRCWIHDTSVGTDSNHPEICSRCKSALAEGIA
jgi:isoleucyl-tRNA synthetase